MKIKKVNIDFNDNKNNLSNENKKFNDEII